MAFFRELLHAKKTFEGTAIDPLPLHKAIDLLPINQATSHMECTLLALPESHGFYCNDCSHFLVFHVLVEMPLGDSPLILSLCCNEAVFPFHLIDDIWERFIFRDVEALDDIAVFFPIAGLIRAMVVLQGRMIHPADVTQSPRTRDEHWHLRHVLYFFRLKSPVTVEYHHEDMTKSWEVGMKLFALIFAARDLEGGGTWV